MSESEHAATETNDGSGATLEIQGEWRTQVPNGLIRTSSLSIGARFLWITIMSFASPSNRHPFPSRDTLCRILDVNKDTLTRYKQELMRTGWLSQSQDKKGPFGRNVYTLHLSPCPDSTCPKISDTEKSDTEKSDTKDPDNKKTHSNLDPVLKNTPPLNGEGGVKSTKPIGIVSLPPEAEVHRPVADVQQDDGPEPDDPNYVNPITKQPEIPRRTQMMIKARSVLIALNQITSSSFAECRNLDVITDRLLEVDGDVQGVIDMIRTQTDLWRGRKTSNGQPGSVCLTPKTLFDPVKFHSYYGQRKTSKPIATSNGERKPEKSLYDELKEQYERKQQ